MYASHIGRPTVYNFVELHGGSVGVGKGRALRAGGEKCESLACTHTAASTRLKANRPPQSDNRSITYITTKRVEWC